MVDGLEMRVEKEHRRPDSGRGGIEFSDLYHPTEIRRRPFRVILSAAAMLAVMACSSPSSDKDNVFGRAEKGDPNAQFVLGHKHDTGEGVAQDFAEAAKWYRKAAEQGHAEAQFNLGTMYDEGRGVRQDYAEAAKWYRKAKDQGVASVR
jgi:TPR repeat protein